MQYRFTAASLVAAVALSVTGNSVRGAIEIDGIFTPSEWADSFRGTQDSWINGQNETGGYLRTDRYSAVSDGFLHMAIVADKSFVTTKDGVEVNAFANKAFPGVNLYVYSGSSAAGTYGNGDDFIFEGSNLNYSRPGPTVWAEAYLTPDANGDFYDGDTLVASYALNDNVYEAKLSLDALQVDEKGHTSLRFGGQTWAYGFTYSTAPVPEPTALSLLALGGLALVRRRRA